MEGCGSLTGGSRLGSAGSGVGAVIGSFGMEEERTAGLLGSAYHHGALFAPAH